MSSKNSKQKADRGDAYVSEEKPKDEAEITEFVNMWAYYVQVWGKNVHGAIRKCCGNSHGKGGAQEKARDELVAHLDPPPPPWEPS